MMTTRMGWLMAVTATLLMVSAGAAEPPPADDATSPRVTYGPYKITVNIKKNEQTGEYTVEVDDDLLEVKETEPPLGAGRPVGIRWILEQEARADWSLIAIQWDSEKLENAKGDGNKQFEADINAPGAGVAIHLIDKFTDRKDTPVEDRTYAYRVWVAPKTGMGPPISSDPAIRNDPQ